MFLIDLWLMAVTMSCLAAASIISVALARKLRKVALENQDDTGAFAGDIQRVLSALPTVKASRAESREAARIGGLAEKTRRSGIRVNAYNALLMPSMNVGTQGALAVVVGVGMARVARGEIDMAGLTTFIMYLFQLVSPLVMFFMGVGQFVQGRAAIQRVDELARLPQEADDPAGAADPAPLRQLARHRPAVEFHDVRFAYRRGKRAERTRVLDGVSFSVPARGLTAVVGPSGAGKTTVDGPGWRRLMGPLLERSEAVVDLVLFGQRGLPRDPAAALLLASRVALHGSRLGAARFRGEEAPALLTGVAAHAVGKLPSVASAAVAMLLGHLAQGTGWPLPRGGSGRIAQALAEDITAHGGVFPTGHHVADLSELHGARAVLLDTSPKGLLALAGGRLPRAYARALERFRYGPGAAKVDFLVSEPIPWTDPAVGRAGTVHLGGTHAGMVRQETANAHGVRTGEPFVLVVDPAVTDPGRALPGKRPVWAYAHVPNGDPTDPYDLVRARIERYAPGFGDTVVAHGSVAAAA